MGFFVIDELYSNEIEGDDGDGDDIEDGDGDSDIDDEKEEEVSEGVGFDSKKVRYDSSLNTRNTSPAPSQSLEVITGGCTCKNWLA